MISYARGDLRRFHEHARDAYEWFVPQGATARTRASPGRVLLAMGDLVEAEAILRAGLAATGYPTTRH